MSVLGRATGKNRKRKRNDFYPTIDPRAIPPLLNGMARAGDGPVYAEPCAGAGDLMHFLDCQDLHCAWACDIEPQRRYIARHDAMSLTEADCAGVDCFITNPPWTREYMHPMIGHLARLRPIWMLFDAAWKETVQSAPYGRWCSHIAAVGRLKFFPPRGKPMRETGESDAAYAKRSRRDYDPPYDCSWYRFDARQEWDTIFLWRVGGEREPAQQMALGL